MSPAIRDFAQNYSAVTTATVLCPSPDTLQNDLLVALASNDTNAGTLFWIGGEPCTNAFLALTGGTVFTNYTTAFNNATASDFWITNTTSVLNDAFYVGHTEPFNGLSIQQTVGSSSAAWTWEYSTGTSTWATLTTLVTGIIPSVTVGVHNTSFNPPGNWAVGTVNAVANVYWIRIRCSTAGTLTTRITCSQGWIGKWNQLYSVQNTTVSHHAILYKVAGAVEPEEYAIHAQQATNDTKNALITTVKDVDTKIPFAQATSTALSYSETNRDSDQAIYLGSVVAVGQSFLTPAAVAPATTGLRMSSCKFYIKKVGSPTGNIQVVLNTHSGTLGTSSIATTPILAKSFVVDITTLTTSYQLIEFTFPWWYQYWMLPATNYFLSIEYANGDASNYLHVGYDASTPSHAGNKATKTGTTWTAQSTNDCCFYAYYFNYATNSNTTGRSVLPTLSTERINSLILYNASLDSVVVPSIIEGPCTLITAKDGSAHSDAMSWGFQNSIGTTPATVYRSCLGTAWFAAHSTIVINPPASGASIIPPYCASDASVYISPSTGATYLTDAAPVVTATTYFGSTLNTKPLVSSATTITYADTGINSYHAMRCVSGVVTPKTWSGNVVVQAARNFDSKNILFHVQTYLPVGIQTTDSVSLDGACGLAIGFASTANTNYRVWHVGGANTPWGISRHIPVIVNCSASATSQGMIQNTGTLNPASVVNLGVFVSGKVVRPQWLIGSIWALDTTVVAGGNSTYPLNIAGIVQAAADGHERRSIIQEGSSQFMTYQPLQIGNGGIDLVYLQLDSTALEMPKQYDKAAKTVNYCSVDNIVGLTYYAGLGDVIIHKNSVISSQSKYHWKFHPSSVAGISAPATSGAYYDFDGLSVIGAGIITLHASVNLSGVTFNSCDEITHPDNTLTNCVFTTTSASGTTYGALMISSTTLSTIQSGINKLVGCSFTNNIKSAGALHLKYTGSSGSQVLNMSVNNFSGNTKDIFWDAPASSNLTINLTNGANPSTYIATNSNVVTFVSSNSISITNVPASAEVRIFRNSDQVELCGVENINYTTPSNCTVASDPDNAGKYKLTYTHSNTSLAVYIVVCHVNYQFYRQDYTLTNTTQELLTSLINDRQFFNP